MKKFDNEQKEWITETIFKIRELDFGLAELGFTYKNRQLINKRDLK